MFKETVAMKFILTKSVKFDVERDFFQFRLLSYCLLKKISLYEQERRKKGNSFLVWSSSSSSSSIALHVLFFFWP